ncbi:MAG: response regulator transcription factor [Anaerolineales bacterium]
MTVRVLIADDHAVLRSGLNLLLSSQGAFEIVAEASTGIETLTLAEEFQPDLILLDLSMPSLGGLDALPTIKQKCPQTKVLILTMYDEPQYLRLALKNGAAGYVLKKAADNELLLAIHAVLRGGVYVHPSMNKILLEDYLPDTQDISSTDVWDTLSDREQEVLKLVALGFTSAEIGEKITVSPKTVQTYRTRGMEKLGLHNRASLVRFALKNGLISGE